MSTARRLPGWGPGLLAWLPIVMACGSAFALERTFTGAVSNDWLVADNWSPSGVPAAGDDVVVAGGVTVILNADASVDGFTLAGGTLSGSATLTVTSLATWAGGTLAGSGALNTNGNLRIRGDGVKTLSRTLNVGATATWFDNGNLVLSGGRLNILPGAVFSIQNDRPLTSGGGSPRVDNAGTLSKTSNGQTTFSNVPLISTGTVLVQSGTLSLTAGGTYTGVIDAGGATVEFAGGIHSLSATSSLLAATLLCNGGTVNAAGTVQSQVRTQVSAGTLNLTGAVNGLGVVHVGNGTLNVSGSGAVGLTLLTLAAGTLTGTSALAVDGPFTWSGGNLSGSGGLDADGGIILSGAATKTLARTLRNAGDAIWIDSGNLTLLAQGRFHNLASGTWLMQTDADVNGDGTSSRIDNDGVVRKLSGGLTRFSGVAFHNQGEVDLQTGTLELLGGGQHSGLFNFAGATLSLGGAQSFGSQAVLDGARLIVATTTLTHAGRCNVVTSTTVEAGAVSFVGTIDSLGALTISGGSVDLSVSTGAVSVPSLTLTAGALAGSADVTVSGRLTWSGGTMGGSGVTHADGSLWLNGTGGKTLGRTLNNAGEALWSDSGGLNMSGTARFHNLPTGSLSVQTDAALLGTEGVRFVNQGVIRKEAGSLTRISAPLDNAGTIVLLRGSLAASAGGQHSGRLDGGLGSIELTGGHTFAGGSELAAASILFGGGMNDVAGSYAATTETAVTGGVTTLRGSVLSSGAVTVRNATLRLAFDGGVQMPSLRLDFGVIDGSSDVIVTGDLHWSGGSMRGTATTVAMHSLLLDGTGPKTLNRRLRNAGTGRWQDTSNISIGDGGVLENLANATFDIEGDGNLVHMGGNARIDNAGAFGKAAGSLTSVSVPFANSGLVSARSGTLAFHAGYEQSAGVTRLDGGTLRSNTGLTLTGGRLEGSGTIIGAVLNSATVSPGLSPGRLAVTGDYAQSSGGSYHVELAGSSDVAFDQLAVDREVGLDGTLVVSLGDGFVPQPGDRFRILSGARLVGDFSVIEGLVLDIGKGFHRLVEASDMTLVYGEEDCGDGSDNDLDGKMDCADPKCAEYEPCTYTPTPTASPTVTLTPTVTDTPTPTETATHTPRPPCPGDCDGNFEVTVDELLRAVNIALGLLAPESCAAFDTDASGEIEIDEIIIGVNRALLGC